MSSRLHEQTRAATVERRPVSARNFMASPSLALCGIAGGIFAGVEARAVLAELRQRELGPGLTGATLAALLAAF